MNIYNIECSSPEPSVSNRSKASRISCFCSSVNSNFLLLAAAPFLDAYYMKDQSGSETINQSINQSLINQSIIKFKIKIKKMSQTNKKCCQRYDRYTYHVILRLL